ncbi:hypothetical protein C7444_12112 [Sphaerotilus hippei]|uniref:Glycosyltransferase involved in cell wall biosynthesis n=1 Tax=Sphaerotilus hippei TaxID=744406 RepID=A0A318GV17_9BURK|nr:hypothetical protein [Sphaerotilus hippei]PXW93248.1 hypothetical protein C7444_12112 [Sphaerotilus hippei]
MASVQLYSRGLDGHRAAYLGFTQRLLGGYRTDIKGLMFSSNPAMFLMIEESFALYLFSALWRSLFGWKTVGLLFRPKPALYGVSVRLKLKSFLLKQLRRVAVVQTLSIVPASLDSRIMEIADGWIYDFQLWDIDAAAQQKFLEISGSQASGDAVDLLQDLSRRAAGKKIVVAIGGQDKNKGFDDFSNFYSAPGVRDQWLFASGGKVSEDCQVYKNQIEAAGAHVLDRFISDDELMALYAASSVVWCAYSENYDQASGILGRAVQFGIPVIVREGSYSHRFCQTEGIAHVSLGAQIDVLNALNELPPPVQNNLAERFRTSSLNSLHIALWGRSVSESNG